MTHSKCILDLYSFEGHLLDIRAMHITVQENKSTLVTHCRVPLPRKLMTIPCCHTPLLIAVRRCHKPPENTVSLSFTVSDERYAIIFAVDIIFWGVLQYQHLYFSFKLNTIRDVMPFSFVYVMYLFHLLTDSINVRCCKCQEDSSR